MDYQWEYNTKQMMRTGRLPTTCPIARDCDEHIRVLHPTGDYYSCGSFGDDRKFPINFRSEMKSDTIATPLKDDVNTQSMKLECYICDMFDHCNGCKKIIHDHRFNGLTNLHCTQMKKLAPDINQIKEEFKKRYES